MLEKEFPSHERNQFVTLNTDLVSLDGVVVALLLVLFPGTDEGDVDEALVLEELLKDLKDK